MDGKVAAKNWAMTCYYQPAYTKFEVSISAYYEDMDTKYENVGGVG